MPDDLKTTRWRGRRPRHEPLVLVLMDRRARAKGAPIDRLGRPNATAIRIIERRWQRQRKAA